MFIGTRLNYIFGANIMIENPLDRALAQLDDKIARDAKAAAAARQRDQDQKELIRATVDAYNNHQQTFRSAIAQINARMEERGYQFMEPRFEPNFDKDSVGRYWTAISQGGNMDPNSTAIGFRFFQFGGGVVGINNPKTNSEVTPVQFWPDEVSEELFTTYLIRTIEEACKD